MITASERANLPRWTGKPGFFEIWFVVLFEPGSQRAYWFRYTTFSPRLHVGLEPRATLWAAVFDAGAPEPAIAGKAIFPAPSFNPGGREKFGIRIADAALGNGFCSGKTETDEHVIRWDLTFEPRKAPARRAPLVFDHRVPLPTRVAHANSEVVFEGFVEVDGVRRSISGAPGTQKHIWGRRRVEELFWIYCPRFREDEGARLEATAVRPHRKLPGGRDSPFMTPVWLEASRPGFHFHGLPWVLTNSVLSNAPSELSFRAVAPRKRAEVTAVCDPASLVGYVYRDPQGWDAYVAQSDLARCDVKLFARRHPFAPWRPSGELSAEDGAAVEFHSPDPLPGVRYIPWDGTTPPRD